MAAQDAGNRFGDFDLSNIDFFSVLDRLDDGVIITDRDGVILYYNLSQAKIDKFEPDEVLGKKLTEIYDLTDETSMIIQCIKRQCSIKNRTFFYRTIKGNIANSITSVYPVFTNNEVTGAVCFVKDYELLQRSTPMVSIADIKPDIGNGSRFTFADLVGISPDFQRSVRAARKASASSSPIMLFGETGTGKELFAQSIHNHGPRSCNRYVAVNCAAIPKDLLEGVLFGTCKGAFTGAMDKPGLFETANNGTLFLDELLAMPVNLQAKLLRVLQEKTVRRVGSLTEQAVDVKILSSVSSDPREAIKNDQLRIDLFYRLGVVLIKIPPLRKRIAGMTELVSHFIRKLNSALGTHVARVSDRVLELFSEYHWPGNVRELEHLLEGAMNIAGHEDVLDAKHFSTGLGSIEPDNICSTPLVMDDSDINQGRNAIDTGPTIASRRRTMLQEMTEIQVPISDIMGSRPDPERKSLAQIQAEQEKQAISQVLDSTRGNVTQAAKELGLSRQLLHYKLKKYSLVRKEFCNPN
ncbi:MAG: sigma 54-interacting transcriptional regulator [Desulfobacterium sp.]|nr:sigma 54-interacting transcriptional regulator [Desulfobacterium sp.]